MIAGLDEAGRGPVIGPMVIAIAYCHEEFFSKLQKMGVKDSKLLTPKDREKLFEQVIRLVNYEYLVIDIKEIDIAVLENKLNMLEMDKFLELINKHNPHKAIVDCPVKNTEKFQKEMQTKTKTLIQAENKADLNFLIVAAASIIAKEIREREIKKIKDHYDIDFGSGYPSDPYTKEFIKNNWDKYDIFRKSWQTYKVIKEGKVQTTLV